MSTMVLKETLSYYVNNGGSVFCTFLDASNAFDRVNYRQLFKLLVHSMLQPVDVLLLLLHMCNSHVCHVSWNGVCSVPFSVLNEVRQDGIISAVLYCIYFDELLVNWLMQEFADILGIISLALLQTQNTLCCQLIRLELCDLCLLFVIVML